MIIGQPIIAGGGTDTSGVTATAEDVLSPKRIVDSEGNEVTGSIPSKSSATFNTSASDQTISAGQYLSGVQTIKAVKTANISTGNIKHGVTVKVGDDNDDDRIANATGSFYNDGTTYTLSSVGDSIDMGASSSHRYIKTSGLYKPNSTKGVTTWTPTTSDQTISAGTYCTGKQTIKGDANLVAGNILKGKSIFGVSGNVQKYGYFTGAVTTSGSASFTGYGGTWTLNKATKTSLGFTPVVVTTFISGGNCTFSMGGDWYVISKGTGSMGTNKTNFPFTSSTLSVPMASSGSVTLYVAGYY